MCPGATTAPSLIFILPGLFYIRIIPTDQEPMKSRPKIQVGSNEPDWELIEVQQSTNTVIIVILHWCIRFGFSGCVFHSAGFNIHDHQPDFHRNWLDERRKAKSWWPLKCTPSPSLTAHCCTPAPLLWMESKIQPPAGRLWASVGLFSSFIWTIHSSSVSRGAQFCPVAPLRLT